MTLLLANRVYSGVIFLCPNGGLTAKLFVKVRLFLLFLDIICVFLLNMANRLCQICLVPKRDENLYKNITFRK